MPDRRSDERLARAVGAGDEAAFAAIDARYRRALLGYAVSIVRHRQDAEDVVQGTLLNALRALREDRRRPPLRPWLFCIAHNEAVSVLRRRRPQLGLDELSLGVRSLTDDVELRERLGDVLADLQRLPVRQRAALVLRELGGLGYGEVAHALETTPAAARQAVRAARLALAEEAGGRSAACSDVRERLASERRRTRRTRAHLRACAWCREFAERGDRRRRALAGILPLPGSWLFPQLLSGPTAKVAVATGLVGAEVAPVAIAPTLPPATIAAGARGPARPEASRDPATPAGRSRRPARRAHVWPAAYVRLSAARGSATTARATGARGLGRPANPHMGAARGMGPPATVAWVPAASGAGTVGGTAPAQDPDASPGDPGTADPNASRATAQPSGGAPQTSTPGGEAAQPLGGATTDALRASASPSAQTTPNTEENR